MILAAFSFSLYVGMMTRDLSGNPLSLLYCASNDKNRRDENGDEGDDLSALVGAVVEPELDITGAFRELDARQDVIGTPDTSRLPVHRGVPARIIILRDQ